MEPRQTIASSRQLPFTTIPCPATLAATVACTLVLILGVTRAQAQYHFESWTTDNGLPHNSIRAILQSRDGYLWLTTRDGLVRFDGVRFTTFNRTSAPGIASNQFFSLYEDHEGVLWIGTDNAGVSRYQNGRFETLPMDVGRVKGWVKAITSDDNGRVWILADNQVVQWADGRLVGAGVTGFPTNVFNGIDIVHHGPGGGFWSTEDGALALFRRGAVTHWTHREGLIGSRIGAVATDEQGTVWTAGPAGVHKLERGRFVPVDRTRNCTPGKVTKFVSSPKATLACLGRRGDLRLIDLGSGEERSLGPPPAGVAEGLDAVTFYEDREHNLWLGTYAQGLYRTRRHVITTYSQPEGLRDHNVYPVLQDREGAIWIGAWPSTLTRLLNNRVTNYSKEHGLSGEPVTALHEDREGRLWVGAFGGGNGLRVFDKGRFVLPGEPKNVLARAIFHDRHGAMWFGSQDRLVRLDGGQATSFTTQDGLASNYVQVIIERLAGGLWIGGTGGLTLLHNGTFTAYTERNGLPSGNVRALYEDRDAVLWIGTYDGGLARFSDGKFVRYTTREGLFDDGVFQILEDDRDNLWMCSNRGISRVSRAQLNDVAAGRLAVVTTVSYGKRDGMRHVECNGGHSPAGIKARDGSLWFPTQDGVVRIDPSSLSESQTLSPVRIETCLIDRVSVPIDTPVRLSPRHDAFEIQYTALTLVNSERVRFNYMLEGLDSDWIHAGTRRTAYYSHVPPGHYTFKVIAANSDGVWNPEGSSLTVVVLPPFYRTWWFLTLVASGAAAIVVVAWRRRHAQLMRAHAAQQAFSRQLIASQEGERKRIAGELHDSLGQTLAIIKNRALLGLATPEDGDRALEQLREIADASADAIGEVKEIAHNLRPYQLDRLGLTKTLEGMVKTVAATQEIRFAADIDRIDGLLSAATEINLFRIVQESVSNVIAHAGATEAAVRVKTDGHFVEVTITDNGCGFDPAQPAAPDRRSGGLGLIGMAERARLLGASYGVRSAPGSGTTVNMTLDITQDQ